MKYEAEQLRNGWLVRPEGQLGTIGWHPEPWEALFVKARTADEALRKARTIRFNRKRDLLIAQGFVRLVSIPGAVMYGHDDGRCAVIDSEGEVKRYATREEMARALLQE